MRIRHALAGAALGAALALGATGAPGALAAPTAQTTRPGPASPPASYHFYKSYWAYGECLDAGDATGREYACLYGKGTDGKYKYSLYVWY